MSASINSISSNTLPAAVRGEEEGAFYPKARDWEQDRQYRLERSERRAWRVACGACATALTCAIGLASMAPFKTLVPYVISVDRASGNAEVMSTADARGVAQQPLNDKHWAARYVVARESYLWKLLQLDYDTVLALSSDEVGREYAKLYDGPQARDRKYGPNTDMRVEVLSVTLPPDVAGKAVVRFEKRVRRLEAENAEPPQTFVATLAYEYKGSLFGKEKQLLMNPLGYRVTAYRVDAETMEVKPAGR